MSHFRLFLSLVSYFVHLACIVGDVVLGLYKRAAGVSVQRTDELTERENVTGRRRAGEVQLNLWRKIVEIRLCHLGLFRRPRHRTAATTLHMRANINFLTATEWNHHVTILYTWCGKKVALYNFSLFSQQPFGMLI